MPEVKDLQFFDRYYNKGLDWYLSFFRPERGEKAIGELSHNYFHSKENARRIYETLPDVKLLCCLRETGDKLKSSYVFSKSLYVTKSQNLEDFVRLPHIGWSVRYYENLRFFYDLFPRDRILVLFYDDLAADAGAFARRIFSFLGIDPEFKPPSLHERINPVRRSRFGAFGHLIYALGNRLRKLGLAGVVGRFKRSRMANKLLYATADQNTEVNEMELDRYREVYGATYEQLEALIERPLPASWYELRDRNVCRADK